MSTQFRKERHSITNLLIHLVCVTKYRSPVFTAKSLVLVEESFREVSQKMDFQILEFNGETDHIHVLIEYPPKLSISGIVNALKGVSSRRYGQAGHPKPYNKDALWSPSYFASSVGGAPIEILKQYIKEQEKPS
ncbi:MAG: IS200/IS605 family transposase [Microcoleus sp.]|uniref:IS200/IS605 family transposase n=1 Tax=Microcoleus sp. TaxID=44472 RepID=UPI003C7488AE